MNAHYILHVESRYVEEVFEGRVTIESLLTLMDAIYSDPAWDPAFDGVADFTDAAIDVTFEEMWGIVELMRKSGSASRGRWAFVVPSELNLGMTRMYEALSQDLQSQVQAFKRRADALVWLGVAPEQPASVTG